jgi:protein-tyrosine phosphatase
MSAQIMTGEYRILCVCTGNICRSPTAEGVLRHRFEGAGLGKRVNIDSAGTHGYHIGEPPDARSAQTARRRGYNLAGQRARQIRRQDFQEFDLILAMDQGHLRQMLAVMPKQPRAELALMMSFARDLQQQDVPDPYYGEADGFERVLDLIEAAAEGVLSHVVAVLEGQGDDNEE